MASYTRAGQWTAKYRHDRPYKFQGYPALCEYIASDNDGYLFRRFGALNARVLLNMQNGIEAHERKLKKLDKECAEDVDDYALLNSLSWDKHEKNSHPQRAAVVEKLQPLLHRYNEHLVAYSQLRDRESAQVTQVANLKNWIKNRSNDKQPDSGPIVDMEQQYLDAGTDLICITREYNPPIARTLQKSSLVRRMLSKSHKNGQAEDAKTVYYSDKKIEWLCNTITVMLGLLMLYGPMWWLNFVMDDVKRLAVITVFVFLFAIGLSLIGSGRPFETLAATAAYAAVLMVFMQKQQDDNGLGASTLGR